MNIRNPLVLVSPKTPWKEERIVPLEDVCTECEGKGEKQHEWESRKYICGSCNGRGAILNDNGKAIIELMSYYTKSQDSDVLLAQRNI